MHGCASLPCLCSHGTSQCDSCKIGTWWVFVLFCFLLISESREPKQAEWVRLVFYGSFLPLASVFLVSFSFCLSLHLSALVLHLISAPSHPSPYKQLWYFFSVCFRACSCVFGCMCICVNMHVETSRQPWFLSSGTLPMSFETGLSLTWGSSNWLDCLARGCGILLSLPPAQGLQVHPPRLPFWHLFWGSSSDPHDGKARTSLTEPFPQPQCNYWNVVYCMFWNMYVWLFLYIVWFRKFLGGFFLLPLITSVSNMSKTHMCCYVEEQSILPSYGLSVWFAHLWIVWLFVRL